MALSPEIRSDYDKAKKALLRRFGDQGDVTGSQRTEDARWSAISRMTALRQNGRSHSEYIMELEALSDALPDKDGMKKKLLDVWLKGFDDDRDGRTMRLASEQEHVSDPETMARVARK